MPARSIAAPDLMTAMRWFSASLVDPVLPSFFMSIDHSPSEQMDGSEWHHSVLIISQSIEHQALADELGSTLNPSTRILKQWKSATSAYRKRFHQEVFHVLKKYPVLVLASSIKEKAMLQHEAAFANALGITGHYKRITVDRRTKVEFGPYIDSDDEAPKTLVISEKHAPMAIHIAHYMLRVHEHLQTAMSEIIGPVNASMTRVDVMSDKPPNDFSGNYAKLMWLLLGGPATQGKFTWGGFTGAEDQPIDLLADNLAGLINEITQKPNLYIYQGPSLQPPIRGILYWEHVE